ncbi:hypothetical protein L6452_30637 [Arctium lappa]|uniref:Uncharacterized protein n=1 Tax=Arctium lappa TaxID=4217 RepID=A0ACB8ZHV3_ARCLA|nr:hypothetical protein L6452_30637 [Arctium lappa]
MARLKFPVHSHDYFCPNLRKPNTLAFLLLISSHASDLLHDSHTTLNSQLVWTTKSVVSWLLITRLEDGSIPFGPMEAYLYEMMH